MHIQKSSKVAAIAAIFAALILLGMLLFQPTPTASATSWYNRSWFDATYKFNRAVITMPNTPDGYVSGTVDSWFDYEDSDAVQVTINGVTYLTHYTNVVLIAD